MEVLIINGPNLNMLGTRETDIYGMKSLDDVNKFILEYFKKVKLDFFQSNHEGGIIDKIQSSYSRLDGIVINPGAFTHYSYAIRDAISSVAIPFVEVHISNVAARDEFRKNSVISDVCLGTISGLGAYGYVLAVQALAHFKKNRNL